MRGFFHARGRAVGQGRRVGVESGSGGYDGSGAGLATRAGRVAEVTRGRGDSGRGVGVAFVLTGQFDGTG
ncbi:hypothetical protein Cde04nite_20010 [Cellulomonas denverensis]|nr:hypothetical protein Cde04nite_20010 [Cellulomonas denverensis]